VTLPSIHQLASKMLTLALGTLGINYVKPLRASGWGCECFKKNCEDKGMNMNRLKKTFEKLYEKFTKKKTFFERHLDQLKLRGKRTWYEHGKAALHQLEQEGREIKELFAAAGSAANKAQVKAKVKSFGTLYKQLSESTKPVWRQWIEALLIAGCVALVLRHFIFGLYHVPTGSAEPTILVGDRVWGNKFAYRFTSVKRGDMVIFDNPQHKYDRSNRFKQFWQKYVGIPIPLLGMEAGPINMVKRVIAIPGDWLEGRIENNKTALYLNGKKLNEPYVNNFPLIWLRKTVGLIPFKSLGPIPIPAFLQTRPARDGIWYTYDPDKPFDKQPFYTMDRSEVIVIPGYPFIKKPHTPSYKDFERLNSADEFGPIQVPKGKYWVMGDSRNNSHDSRWFGFLDEQLIHGRLSFIIYSVDSEEPLWLFELLKHPIDFWRKSLRWNRFFKRPDAVPDRSVPDRSVPDKWKVVHIRFIKFLTI